nr:hypothetical protein [Tanacetum cinerariifolium]
MDAFISRLAFACRARRDKGGVLALYTKKQGEIWDLESKAEEVRSDYENYFGEEDMEVILFYNGLNVPTRQVLDSKGAIPTKTAADAKIAIQEMAEYSQKWHNGTSSKARSTETSDRLAAIQAQLNNLRREIKKSTRKFTLLRSDANYAKDHTTQRTIHSRKKGILLKRRITHSSEHLINLQESTEQQGQDSTNTTMEILRTLIKDRY